MCILEGLSRGRAAWRMRLKGAALQEGGCSRAQGDAGGTAGQLGTLRNREPCGDPRGVREVEACGVSTEVLLRVRRSVTARTASSFTGFPHPVALRAFSSLITAF